MGGNPTHRTVGDFVSLIRGTTYKGALVGRPGPALLGLGSIEPGGGFRIDKYKTYGGECPEELRLYPGDLYASLKGATKDGDMIGSVARVPESISTGRITQDTVKLVFKDPQAGDVSFLYWMLRTPQYRDYCAGHAMGSAVVALSRSDFLSYPIPEVTPERQHAVSLLDRIEDRIELNRRRNQTLEAMARALFEDWFVDFGPVRAKMEGREPYLPAELWQLFPERLDEAGRPVGWRRSIIGSEVSVCGGATPSTKEPAFWDGGEHHWATPKDLSALTFPVLLDTGRKITDAGIAKISSGLLPVGTVLLSSRAPIGYLAIAEVPTAINQGFIAMKCDGALSNVFVLFWCRENMDLIVGNANGSTFQEISKSNFRPIPLVVPPEPILQAFQERVEPLYRHIVENERESKMLAQLRDTLLPKLISGELRVADAEKFVEHVGP